PFWEELECACRRLISEGVISHPRSLSASAPLPESGNSQEVGDDVIKSQNAVAGVDEIERAAVTRGNLRLTAHTVSTLLCGASRRWTTLTANRASVREVLKETNKETIRRLDAGSTTGVEKTNGANEVAAVWIVEPRSLAEVMRGDFVPGVPL
ncbi:hypothetical protein M0805_005977, partial [Coniferiporia weirii]